MTYYLGRRELDERLRLGARQSFRVVPAGLCRRGLVPSDEVVAILNAAAVGEARVDEIPFDLATAEELEEETGVPARRIALAARRTLDPAPHYRLNGWTLRFRRSSFGRWLARGARNLGPRGRARA